MADLYLRFFNSYRRYRRLHFDRYQAFQAEKPLWHCATCSRFLFREELQVRFLDHQAMQNIHCTDWGLPVICQYFGIYRYMIVCQKHLVGDFAMALSILARQL
ncbi:hypothetical protein [Parasitella parasitica]|uniref:Uncharacterized protein n=1 Tax=Parasitella parasitica TaxID=35722 RepID=A0A0B7N775_9FUNG|nr:hypothetical protein [Parasitella parasitica]